MSSAWRWRTWLRTTPLAAVGAGRSPSSVRALESPAADLPRVFERAARMPPIPRPIPVERQPGRTRPLRGVQCRQIRTRCRRPTSMATSIAATWRSRPGCRRTSSCVNPDLDDVNVTDSGAYSDYHALQLELRRRLSKRPLGERQLPVRDRAWIGVRRLQLRTGDGRAGERPACHQDPVGLDDSGRPRPAFRCNMNPLLDGIVGGWSMNGVGRSRLARSISATCGSSTCRSTSLRTSTNTRSGEHVGCSDGLRAAGGHHPQHPPRVQHRPEDADRPLSDPGSSWGGTLRRPTSPTV